MVTTDVILLEGWVYGSLGHKRLIVFFATIFLVRF